VNRVAAACAGLLADRLHQMESCGGFAEHAERAFRHLANLHHVKSADDVANEKAFADFKNNPRAFRAADTSNQAHLAAAMLNVAMNVNCDKAHPG
jgi:hypothetical protein